MNINEHTVYRNLNVCFHDRSPSESINLHHINKQADMEMTDHNTFSTLACRHAKNVFCFEYGSTLCLAMPWGIQWNLRIKDTWGPEQVSFIQRCPLLGG